MFKIEVREDALKPSEKNFKSDKVSEKKTIVNLK